MSNTTTVYVTHDYQEALALGDRIAVLREGRLVQIGTPEEIWRQARRHLRGASARPAGDQPARRRGRRRRGSALGGGALRRADARPGLRPSAETACRLGLRPCESFTVGQPGRGRVAAAAGTRRPRRAARPQHRARRRRRRRAADRAVVRTATRPSARATEVTMQIARPRRPRLRRAGRARTPPGSARPPTGILEAATE